jgi:hypothetical protein
MLGYLTAMIINVVLLNPNGNDPEDGQKTFRYFALVLHYVHINWYIIELKSFNKTIVEF